MCRLDSTGGLDSAIRHGRLPHGPMDLRALAPLADSRPSSRRSRRRSSPTVTGNAAKSFYGSVFGWQLQTMPMSGGEYTIVMTTPVDEQTQIPTDPGAIN
jgi:hypothetical protein